MTLKKASIKAAHTRFWAKTSNNYTGLTDKTSYFKKSNQLHRQGVALLFRRL